MLVFDPDFGEKIEKIKILRMFFVDYAARLWYFISGEIFLKYNRKGA